MPDLTCQNHKCGAAFAPQWKGQVYCCKTCRMAERNWRKAHGERVLNAALSGQDPMPVIRAVMTLRD